MMEELLNDNALTTVERAKTFLDGEDVEGLDDGRIVTAINAASSAIEYYLGRHLGKRTHSDIVRRDEATLEVTLEEYPVHEVIAINGRPSTRSMYLDQESGIAHFNSRTHGIFDYVAGYILPKDGTPEQPTTLPRDIEHACLMTVKEVYVEEDGYFDGAGSLQLGDFKISDGKASQSDIDHVIPPHVQQLLLPHKKVMLR